MCRLRTRKHAEPASFCAFAHETHHRCACASGSLWPMCKQADWKLNEQYSSSLSVTQGTGCPSCTMSLASKCVSCSTSFKQGQEKKPISATVNVQWSSKVCIQNQHPTHISHLSQLNSHKDYTTSPQNALSYFPTTSPLNHHEIWLCTIARVYLEQKAVTSGYSTHTLSLQSVFMMQACQASSESVFCCQYTGLAIWAKPKTSRQAIDC